MPIEEKIDILPTQNNLDSSNENEINYPNFNGDIFDDYNFDNESIKINISEPIINSVDNDDDENDDNDENNDDENNHTKKPDMNNVFKQINGDIKLNKIYDKFYEDKIDRLNLEINNLHYENVKLFNKTKTIKNNNKELNEKLKLFKNQIKMNNDNISIIENNYEKKIIEKNIEIETIKNNNEKKISEKEGEIYYIKNKFENEIKLIKKNNEIDNIKRENNEKNKIDMKMIDSKCEVYYNLFIRLYDKLTITKKRLDLYQTYLNRINSSIQLSVITLSIASSFIQALDSGNYEIFFSTENDINNFTNQYNNNNYETEVEESTYSSIVGIITLSVSTYSALVIAAERHFSFQQRETNVEKLKESYAEPINRIKNNIELIRPWRYKSYYMKTNKNYNDGLNNDDKSEIYVVDYDYYSENNDKSDDSEKLIVDEDRKKKWIAMVDKLDSEYSHIVDVKKELDTSLDKLVSVKTIKSYQENVPRKKRDINKKNINDMENHANNNNFMYNWWINYILKCWNCKCRKVNHTYDEEDLNHIEDIEEIKQLNKEHSEL